MTVRITSESLVSLALTRGLLAVAGLIAAGISVTILFAADTFYAGYGIDAGQANLANELKAPAGLLLVAGLVMLAGVTRQSLFRFALATGTVLYLSYGLSRIVSIAVDGVPGDGLVAAAALEIVIGFLCLLDLRRRWRFAPVRWSKVAEAAS